MTASITHAKTDENKWQHVATNRTSALEYWRLFAAISPATLATFGRTSVMPSQCHLVCHRLLSSWHRFSSYSILGCHWLLLLSLGSMTMMMTWPLLWRHHRRRRHRSPMLLPMTNLERASGIKSISPTKSDKTLWCPRGKSNPSHELNVETEDQPAPTMSNSWTRVQFFVPDIASVNELQLISVETNSKTNVQSNQTNAKSHNRNQKQ